jgi:hypothetical protein
MAKYGISLSIGASSYVEVEADSPEDAVSKAYESDAAQPTLCWHCTNSVEVTEAYEATISTVDGSDYEGPQPGKDEA